MLLAAAQVGTCVARAEKDRGSEAPPGLTRRRLGLPRSAGSTCFSLPAGHFSSKFPVVSLCAAVRCYWLILLAYSLRMHLCFSSRYCVIVSSPAGDSDVRSVRHGQLSLRSHSSTSPHFHIFKSFPPSAGHIKGLCTTARCGGG